jgi:hypothetical protein
MKFQYIPPPNRAVSSEGLIADIRSVSASLNNANIKISDYKQHGKYSFATVKKRFGNWNKAKIEAGIATSSNIIYRKTANHIHRNVSNEELTADLKRVSSLLNQPKLSYAIYSKHGKYSKQLFKNRFRTWNKALAVAGLELAKAGHYTNEELFANLLEVWKKRGKQPTKTSFDDKGLSSICATVYTRRFGSIEKTLKAFIEFIDKKEIQTNEHQALPNFNRSRRTPRDPSVKLRFQVFIRDRFTCKCGRSPAKDPSIELHIDHIKPWSAGGDTVLHNLQVLCSICNLGKSNL